MEISKMLTICTSHLTDATLKSLDKEAEGNNYPCIGVYKKEDYGYFIYIDKNAYRTVAGYNEMPADLRTVISFTIEAGCDILCLDSDGEELICLPHYEYESVTVGQDKVSNEQCFIGGTLIHTETLPYRV